MLAKLMKYDLKKMTRILIIMYIISLAFAGVTRLINIGKEIQVVAIIGGVFAEIEMILGYFVFEGALYGFGPSVVNIPANAVQAAAGLILGCILVKVFEKTNIFH